MRASMDAEIGIKSLEENLRIGDQDTGVAGVPITSGIRATSCQRKMIDP